MTDGRDRRSVLRAGAALCTFGVAGCLGNDGDGDDSTGNGAADDNATPNGTDPGDNGTDSGGTGTEPPNGTDPGGNDTDPGGTGTDSDGNDTDPDGNGTDPGNGDPEPEPVTSWPMQQFDAQNTGAVPNAAGVPTENVSELWSRDLGAELHCSPVVADGTVYVGDVSGIVHAYDAEGTQQWTASVSGSEVVATPAIYDDLLLVLHDGGVDANGSLAAVSTADSQAPRGCRPAKRICASPR